MSKLLFWATVASGVAAAYLMMKRGESPASIAKKILTHPVGSLVDELKTS